MLKIAICDDDEEICKELEKILKKIAEENEYDFEMKIFNSVKIFDENFFENDNNFDIIFLDIEFPGEQGGIYIGNKIKNEYFKENVKIIYISSFEHRVKELFEIRPFDFMNKPIEYLKTKKIIDRAIKIMTLQNKSFEYCVYKDKYVIDLYKILYFQITGRKIRIITKNNNLSCDTFNGKISDIYKKLPQSDFFFCHKSFLVNYHNVSEFQYKELTMINGDTLNISQYYQKAVREMRNKKMGEN